MRLSSLRARLIAGTVVWMVAALGTGGLLLSDLFTRSVERTFEDRLQSLLHAVIAAIQPTPNVPVELARVIADPRFDRVYSGWYWQVVDGDTRLRSRSLWDTILDVAPSQLESEESARIAGPRGQQLRLVGKTLHYPGIDRPIVVAVAGPEHELQAEVARFNWMLSLSLATLGLGLAAAVTVQVGYGLRPLRQLAGQLEGIRSGRRRRLDRNHPQEIQALVDAMNDLLDHDERLIERARTHVADLAHGLKTPLAVLNVETGHDDQARDRIQHQVMLMSRLINHHLTRAAAAGARDLLGSRAPVAPVVQALKGMFERIHADKQLTIDIEVPPALAFAGEQQDLEEMLGNLVDNACKWSAGRVSIRAERDRDKLSIEVEDDGPGMAPGDLDLAIERGARFDPDERGFGLGLAITADLAKLYGGELKLRPGDTNGLCAKLLLPASD